MPDQPARILRGIQHAVSAEDAANTRPRPPQKVTGKQDRRQRLMSGLTDDRVSDLVAGAFYRVIQCPLSGFDRTI